MIFKGGRVQLPAKLLALATVMEGSALRGRNADDLALRDGRFPTGGRRIKETVTSVLRRAGLTELSCDGRFDPGGLGKVRSGDARETPRGMLGSGRFPAKVAVDRDLGLIRVRTLTGADARGAHRQPQIGREPTHRRHYLGHEPGTVRGDSHDVKSTGVVDIRDPTDGAHAAAV